MIEALNKKGYNAFSISVPSPDELLTVLGLAAPVFLTMMSKVTLYCITQFCSCIWSHVIISLYLRYFNFFRWLSSPSSHILPHLWAPTPWPLIKLVLPTLEF